MTGWLSTTVFLTTCSPPAPRAAIRPGDGSRFPRVPRGAGSSAQPACWRWDPTASGQARWSGARSFCESCSTSRLRRPPPTCRCSPGSTASRCRPASDSRSTWIRPSAATATRRSTRRASRWSTSTPPACGGTRSSTPRIGPVRPRAHGGPARIRHGTKGRVFRRDDGRGDRGPVPTRRRPSADAHPRDRRAPRVWIEVTIVPRTATTRRSHHAPPVRL